jgi:hypothetical protein
MRKTQGKEGAQDRQPQEGSPLKTARSQRRILLTNTRRWLASIVAALGCATCAIAVLAGSATAAFTHQYEFSFGSIAQAAGIAVDESRGDVYVYSRTTNAIYKFDSAGAPSEFSGLKSDAIESVPHGGNVQLAVDNSSGPAKGDIYIAVETQGTLVYSQSGKLIGKVNSEYGDCGVAVDPKGNVYVSERRGIVNKYTPTSNPVSSTNWVSALWGLGATCYLTTGSDGSLYAVDVGADTISKYDPLQFNALGLRTESSYEFTFAGMPAVDLTNDDLYIDHGEEVLVYDSTGALQETIAPVQEAARFSSHAIAVNGANGQVYIGDDTHARIEAFGPPVIVPDVTTNSPSVSGSSAILQGTVNPDGTHAECSFEYGTSTTYEHAVPCVAAPGSGGTPVTVTAEVTGLKMATFYHYRLVATNENGVNAGADQTFAPAVPPVVSQAWSVNVQLTSATVEATVRPMGNDTTYHIEYGTGNEYGSSVPLPDAQVGTGFETDTVKQLLTGLQPGTNYHYRVVAANADGSASRTGTFITFATPAPVSGDACPNAAFRLGASVGLPDCRAYEMVSPVEKDGGEVASYSLRGERPFAAANSGERVAFDGSSGFGDTHGSGDEGLTEYVASRGPMGWSTKGITPTPAVNAVQLFTDVSFATGFSEELDRAVILAFNLPGVEDARPGVENLYLENTATGELTAVTDARNEGEHYNLPVLAQHPYAGGGSSDLGVVAFAATANLVLDATGTGLKAYAFENGAVKLIGVLPDGSVPSGGSFLPVEDFFGQASIMKDTVSRDGSRILFVAPASGDQQLYMRKDGASSVLVSESETSTPVTAENVHFAAASPDLTHVLFSTSSRLLDSAPSGGGLYMYTDSANPREEANLTYIGEGKVLGISEDGSRVDYNDGNAVYMWDEAQVHKIVKVKTIQEVRVTSDARQIVFTTNENIIPNLDILKMAKVEEDYEDVELYLYAEGDSKVRCVSCPPTGAAVTQGVETVTRANRVGIASPLPAQPRFFSSDGRYVFFNTEEALVPQDINGVTDAYEYNTETGKLSLLSTGTGKDGAWFVEAGADGRDAFIATNQQLSPWDPDKLTDLYDARVGGGLPGPPAPKPPCAGDACQGTPSAAPSFNTASGFSGLGNPLFTRSEKATAKSTGRARRLKQALAFCRKKKGGHARLKCESATRKRYRTKRTGKHARRTGG